MEWGPQQSGATPERARGVYRGHGRQAAYRQGVHRRDRKERREGVRLRGVVAAQVGRSVPERRKVLSRGNGPALASHDGGPGRTALPVQSLGSHRLPLVELTGGEPLLQKNALPLMRALCDEGFTVLLETSGAHDIAPVDPRVRRIMDLKCPSSGEVARNRWENLAHLKATDEIKFVLGTQEDYAWAKEQIAKHQLASVCPLLMSWVHPLRPEQQDKSLKRVPAGQTPITRQQLVEQIIADHLPVRFQAQLHKIIWPPEQRGV